MIHLHILLISVIPKGRAFVRRYVPGLPRAGRPITNLKLCKLFAFATDEITKDIQSRGSSAPIRSSASRARGRAPTRSRLPSGARAPRRLLVRRSNLYGHRRFKGNLRGSGPAAPRHCHAPARVAAQLAAGVRIQHYDSLSEAGIAAVMVRATQ